MKLQLKGFRFDRVEEIQRKLQNVLCTLREQDFKHNNPQKDSTEDRGKTIQTQTHIRVYQKVLRLDL
jgi:hypothetical protein